MNKVVLCSILLFCFSLSAEGNKVNMPRLEAELLKARQRFSVSKKRKQQAYSELKKVDLHKKFEEELKKCELAKNCEKNPEFLEAQAALINSDAYTHFSPIYNEFIYDQLRYHGLEKMVLYVKHNVGYSDIEAIRRGADSALNTDTFGNLTLKTEQIRDKVYKELLDLIESEDSNSYTQDSEKAAAKENQ